MTTAKTKSAVIRRLVQQGVPTKDIIKRTHASPSHVYGIVAQLRKKQEAHNSELSRAQKVSLKQGSEHRAIPSMSGLGAMVNLSAEQFQPPVIEKPKSLWQRFKEIFV